MSVELRVSIETHVNIDTEEEDNNIHDANPNMRPTQVFVVQISDSDEQVEEILGMHSLNSMTFFFVSVVKLD